MEKDALFIRRMQDLALSAERKNCVTFTDFLNLNEQNIFYHNIQKFSWIHGETFGGYEGAERRIAAFVPEEVYWSSEEDSTAVSPSGICYPIRCIQISVRAPKFAEKFSHRDLLGALMNLGIDRSKTGDIALTKEASYLFCSAQFQELICRELTKVRHTQVQCEPCERKDFTYTPAVRRIQGSVASIRLDALMALGFGASRSSLLSLIEGGRVFVNGKLVTGSDYSPQEGDIISVRGMGRFKFTGAGVKTRKGRITATVERYV